ncbi:hypothetical protein VA596_41775 [Amycolatopsis sp., V23-08]|uniref:Uncharacterized protein n=1 Tax=Amycolatopsis heterodermiae TaxID=3110235 RepID=A0ABU5RIK7_9PSEU|nr:hypothetical protein [Amycolatopsis sp., V23-08]MEA5366117.1 hypothetical protein [Amycolatopsis sp., V23-08]
MAAVTRHLARAAVLLAGVVGLQLSRASELSYAGPVFIVAGLVLVGLVRWSWRASGYTTAERSSTGRRVAIVAASVAILSAAAVGGADAQDGTAAPPASPEPTLGEPSPSTTPSAEPAPEPTATPSSATPTPTTAVSTTPATPTSSATPPPSSAPRASTSAPRRTAQSSETGAGAAAVPGPSTTSTTGARPTDTEYSWLAPWRPASDRPEIPLLAAIMILGGGGGFLYVLERGRGRRQRARP